MRNQSLQCMSKQSLIKMPNLRRNESFWIREIMFLNAKFARWPMSGVMARLCNTCAFDQDKCIKCGKYIGSGGVMARLCNTCASDQDKCIKCSRYIG